MIGFLSGIVREKEPPCILLDVNGVGYEVQAPLRMFPILPEIGGHTNMYTHLQVREDSHSIYGFETHQERDVFRLLISINGVGARIALAILSELGIEELISSVHLDNSKVLVKVPGIGEKTAKRLLVQMREKFEKLPFGDIDLPQDMVEQGNITSDAIEALISLGYSRKEASGAVNSVKNGAESVYQIVRLALQSMNVNAL